VPLVKPNQINGPRSINSKCCLGELSLSFSVVLLYWLTSARHEIDASLRSLIVTSGHANYFPLGLYWSLVR